MSKVQLLKELIDKTLQGAGTSKLDDVALSVGGFISPNNRHFLNNLGAISKNYYEVGSHIGSSLVSAVYKNDNLQSAHACDNFSLFHGNNDTKTIFEQNCNSLIPRRYKLLNKDCWTVKEDELPKIDLYLFDGAHDYESQKNAITYYAPFLADECIIVVDDFSWYDVNKGTMDGIREAGLKVDYFGILWSGVESDCSDKGFWNGYGVFLICK